MTEYSPGDTVDLTIDGHTTTKTVHSVSYEHDAFGSPYGSRLIIELGFDDDTSIRLWGSDLDD